MKPVRCAPFALLLPFAACKGDGSEVGPVLADLPAASCRVSVRDDAGRAVTGARDELAKVMAALRFMVSHRAGSRNSRPSPASSDT